MINDVVIGPQPVQIQMHVNGETRSLAVAPQTTLVDAIRDHMDLLGTKVGCAHGQCGACTVLINGERRHSCLTLAIMHDGDALQTIEGVSGPEELHPLQQAFIKHDAFQCGFCTPGQIMSGLGLITEGHARSAQEVREQMSGNLCRCAAYQNIVSAILEVQQQSTGSREHAPVDEAVPA